MDGGGTASRPPENFSILRQSSIYSLTFDEFHSAMDGVGKDFGSMNMDELLKNIWTAEETQILAAAAAAAAAGGSGDNGQQAGTLCLKTVDEVWGEISSVPGDGRSNGGGGGGGGAEPYVTQQRQQTLGEITLEEFLVRAGVVMEDTQQSNKPNAAATGFFLSDLAQSCSGDTGFGINFQPPSRGIGTNNHIPVNVNGVKSSKQPTPPPPQQQQPIFASSAAIKKNNNNNLAQDGGGGGGGGLAVGAFGGVTTAIASSPAALSSDGVAKSSGETPSPDGGLRGRKYNNAVEKVIERRQRRMIKNRESAARSRARKQAYTTELELELAKLKEENQELRKKQVEIMEMQKNQALEMLSMQRGQKRQCLRRTQSGHW
ncbi:ARM REPEAT PROTEIN INTERACTING WITH abf2 [Dionaea muscipula]